MGATVLTVVQGPVSPAGLAEALSRGSVEDGLADRGARARRHDGIWIPGPLYRFVERAAAVLEHAP